MQPTSIDQETTTLMTGFGGLIKMVAPKVESPFKCPQCDHHEFQTYSDLLHHTAYCHSNLKGTRGHF